MKQLTIRISDELHKKLGHYCVDHEKSINELVVELLERLVGEEKKSKPKK